MSSLFIVNPRAGRGRGAKLAAALPHMLEARGLVGRVAVTSRPKEATALAREAAASLPLVVAVGGDGTANEVVNGLAETDAVFGLVPVGSGNDLALALGIPSDTEAALDVVAGGETARIDLGRWDDGWFANSLGLGFEAQVTVESRGVRHLRGFSIYLWALLKALRKLRCPRLTIRADEHRLDGRRLLVCVGNGPRVGGGFYLTPDAHPADGLLDLCVVDAVGRARVLQTLPRSLNGSHVGQPIVTMLRARAIDIESPDGFPFHVDGEVVATGQRRLTIRIHPRALRVRVPSAERLGGG